MLTNKVAQPKRFCVLWKRKNQNMRAPCCEKMGLKKGLWTAEEDQILISFIKRNGHSNWRALPKLAGLSRCGKSCRLRWINYLKPGVKRGNFNQQEQDIILQLHENLGNRWSAIAAQLPGRTDNEIKNFWHTHLKKRAMNKQSHVSEKRKANSAIVEAKSKPTQNLECSNQYEFASSSLGFSSLPDSPILMWDAYDERQNKKHIEIVEAFHQTCGGHWAEEPLSANFDGPILDSSAMNNEEQVELPFRAMDSMEFGLYYDNDTEIDDNMEFWYKVFVKAGGSPNDPAI